MKPPLWQRLDDRFEPNRRRRALAEHAALLAGDSTDIGAPGGRVLVVVLRP